MERLEVSEGKLKDWKGVGVFPRGRQGEGIRGRRGRPSYYPPWALQQLKLVADTAKRWPRERIEDLTFDVWWDGGWVDPTAITDYHRVSAETLQSLWQADHIDTAARIVEQVRARPRDPLPRALVRYSKGIDKLDTTAVGLLRLLSGESIQQSPEHDDIDEDDPRETVVRGLGFERFQTDDIAGLGPIGEPMEPEQVFGAFRTLLFDDAGQFATPDECDELYAFRSAGAARTVHRLLAFSHVTTAVEGRDAAGLGLIVAAGRQNPRFMRAVAGLFAFVTLDHPDADLTAFEGLDEAALLQVANEARESQERRQEIRQETRKQAAQSVQLDPPNQ